MNIYGKNDVISCKNELISKSKFNKLNAINLLRFIIYDQLLFFLKVLPNNDTFSKKIISKYILTIFQINHKNNRNFDIPF